MLDFSDEVQNLQRRVATVAAWHPELELPDLSTETVLDRAPEWLPSFIGKVSTTAELKRIDLCEALWSLLDWPQRQAVERLAPSRITVPTEAVSAWNTGRVPTRLSSVSGCRNVSASWTRPGWMTAAGPS